MGIQKKARRLDKWYKLAKEKGYRARAAFKLIQLNRKYGFLEKSKVLLDLCAAPGSWCQVAAETMPVNSLIVGVDLAPIKPIPKTTTFQGDITSDKCRATIRQHFKTWKADTVLHDGAPNVGTAWVQDAFSQAELALQALKLAVEFLVEGGTFVTKVFRSKDYNALLWVCNQLFMRVEATKPPSSRNVSAEIFVVCRGFKAPKKIDPKFLDPRSVFAELSNPTPNNEAKVFNPEVKKRKREGYDEGDYIQFREAAASDFVQTTDPIAMLGSLNRLHFEDPKHENIALAALLQLPETTSEIKHCCSDLRVLGRKDFRMLLRWRLKAREKFGLNTKRNKEYDTNEEVIQVTPMDQELQIQEELQRFDQNETARKKRERRRAFDKKQKEIVRMQMNMLPPTEIGLEQAGPNGEDSMFTLAATNRAGMIDRVVKGNMGVVVRKQTENESDSGYRSDTDEEEDALDSELDTLYQQYQQRRVGSDTKSRAKRARTQGDENTWEGFADSANDSDEDVEMDIRSESSSNYSDEEMDPGVRVNCRSKSTADSERLTHRAALFFDQDIFRSVGITGEIDSSDSESYTHKTITSNNLVRPAEGTKAHADTPQEVDKLQYRTTGPSLAGREKQAAIAKDKQIPMARSGIQSHSGSEGTEVDVAQHEDGNAWVDQLEPQKNGRPDIDIITAEAMTLAQQVATGAKRTQDLVDDSFNKYTLRDIEGLPEWFLDDEGRHSKPHRPIDAAAAAAIKEKLRALNVRPIKKVREAKERKKFKAAQRLEKLRKKSALLADEGGVSEKDKAQSIAKMMSKAVKKKPKKEVKLVVARGGNRGISGRPRGVKGKYKIVDARLKKDTRAEKSLKKKRG
ncbi:MAG: hypothetical protein Q9218_001992 [Villophora microphyllina]